VSVPGVQDGADVHEDEPLEQEQEQELARVLVDAAAGGLCRQNCCGQRGDDERV
jgi:hypothetical protein